MHQALETHDDRAPGFAPVELLRPGNPYGVPHEAQIEAVAEAIMIENAALRRAGLENSIARERLRLNRAALMGLSVAMSNLRLGAAVVALECQDAEATQGVALRLVHRRPDGEDAVGRQDLRSRGEPRISAPSP
jgi:hypothetical protein